MRPSPFTARFTPKLSASSGRHFLEPSCRSAESQLGDIVVDDRVEVVAASLRESLHGLQGLDRQPLGVLDPLHVQVIRAFGRLNARLGNFDPLVTGLHLAVRFDYFLSDAVHHDDFVAIEPA